MKTIKTAILLISLVMLQLRLGDDVQAQERPMMRPYGRLGFLLTPPSTADLEYGVNGQPGDLDDIQDVDCQDFGFGCQLLMKKKTGFCLGGEIGYQKLFSSKITGDVSNIIYYSNDYDREWELYLNALIEFSPKDSPLFIQVGSGLHLVFWEWEYEFSSKYFSKTDSDGGSDVNFGLMAALGTKLRTGPYTGIPVAVRTDIIFRYGIFFQIGLIFGLDL